MCLSHNGSPHKTHTVSKVWVTHNVSLPKLVTKKILYQPQSPGPFPRTDMLRHTMTVKHNTQWKGLFWYPLGVAGEGVFLIRVLKVTCSWISCIYILKYIFMSKDYYCEPVPLATRVLIHSLLPVCPAALACAILSWMGWRQKSDLRFDVIWDYFAILYYETSCEKSRRKKSWKPQTLNNCSFQSFMGVCLL